MNSLRTKFFIVDIDQSLDSIAETFSKYRFTEKRGSGININSLDYYELVCTFIEKKHVVEKIILPNGATDTFEHDRYIYVDFKLSPTPNHNSYYILQVHNPPQSIKSLSSIISKLLPGSGFHQHQMNLDVFTKSIKSENHVSRLKAHKLWASSLRLSDNSIAKIELSSENNALTELKSLYRDFILEKIQLSFRFESNTFQVIASKNCSIIYDSLTIEETIKNAYLNSISFQA
ncbi:MAG: hypothetical protein CMK89_12200 [Pseudomonadales bacterium]|nr:hypothetical protein [Pseudomonadales bacterium]